MKNQEGGFTKLKRWIIFVSGVGVAYCSILLSKQGVGLSGEFAWMGTVIAVALFCAELLFNSNFDDLNWTILALGLGAYVYSIWTNISGFYFYRGLEMDIIKGFDVTSVFGGIFMDVWPELSIAWSLKESKIGDLIGNLIKTSRDPDKLTQLAHPLQTKQPQTRGQPPNRNLQPGLSTSRPIDTGNGKTRAELLRQKMQSSKDGHYHGER